MNTKVVLRNIGLVAWLRMFKSERYIISAQKKDKSFAVEFTHSKEQYDLDVSEYYASDFSRFDVTLIQTKQMLHN